MLTILEDKGGGNTPSCPPLRSPMPIRYDKKLHSLFIYVTASTVFSRDVAD